MELLTVSGVCRHEGNNLVVNDISFSLRIGQKIAIAGETGSGKSTLLKIIGTYVQAEAGSVVFEQKKLRGPDEKLLPGHPGIAYLSQHFELRNSYRVEEILEYANLLTDEEANSLYEICRITHLLKRRTDQLSGGEKQRIAMARLLVGSPRLLLLDEPFSNLDPIHKSILKTVIRNISEQLGTTVMMASHDPIDTLPWADQIFVMKEGRFVQQASTHTIYHQPINEYVGGLFGTYNLIPANSPLHAALLPNTAGTSTTPNQHNSLFVRPEQLKLSTRKSNASAKGKVSNVFFMGSCSEVEVFLAEQTLLVKTSDANLQKGDTVHLSLISDDPWYL